MDHATCFYYVDEDGDVARRTRLGRDDSSVVGGVSLAALDVQLDAVRVAIGRVDALAALAAEQFNNKILCDADPVQVNRVGHLVEATAEAARIAVAAAAALTGLCATLAPAGDA